MKSPAEVAAAVLLLVPAAFVGFVVYVVSAELLERRARTPRRRPKEPRRTRGRRRDGAA